MLQCASLSLYVEYNYSQQLLPRSWHEKQGVGTAKREAYTATEMGTAPRWLSDTAQRRAGHSTSEFELNLTPRQWKLLRDFSPMSSMAEQGNHRASLSRVTPQVGLQSELSRFEGRQPIANTSGFYVSMSGRLWARRSLTRFLAGTFRSSSLPKHPRHRS